MGEKYFAIVSAMLLAFLGEAAASKQSKHTYTLNNRHDPFMPFLNGQQNMPPDLPLAPLQNQHGLSLEPGQLKLAAVIATPDGRKAMAEDVAGKGYFLYEGLPVGRYGAVRKIEKGQVVIEETWRTPSGRLVVKETVMRLKTEGE